MELATIQAWLPTAVASGLLAVVWIDVRRARTAWRRALYREDGTPIYVMREECRREQHDCQGMVCTKITAVQVKLDSMDARREEQRNVVINQIMQMSARIEGLASRLDEYIRTHR
jgi:hypothetical protein